jgi:hypothetical protein
LVVAGEVLRVELVEGLDDVGIKLHSA